MPSTTLTKFIDELLFKMTELKNISTGDKVLTPADGTTVYRFNKVTESIRIVNGIYAVFDRLSDEQKLFIREYYWSNKQKKLSVVAEYINADVRTIKRWKKEVNVAIAKKLGWL